MPSSRSSSRPALRSPICDRVWYRNAWLRRSRVEAYCLPGIVEKRRARLHFQHGFRHKGVQFSLGPTDGAFATSIWGHQVGHLCVFGPPRYPDPSRREGGSAVVVAVSAHRADGTNSRPKARGCSDSRRRGVWLLYPQASPVIEGRHDQEVLPRRTELSDAPRRENMSWCFLRFAQQSYVPAYLSHRLHHLLGRPSARLEAPTPQPPRQLGRCLNCVHFSAPCRWDPPNPCPEGLLRVDLAPMSGGQLASKRPLRARSWPKHRSPAAPNFAIAVLV